MKYVINFSRRSVDDILEIKAWYNSKQKGLGQKFAKDLLQRITFLEKNAAAFAVRFANVRCVLLQKFPFVVYYQIVKDSNIVEIISVYHTSRNPYHKE